MMKRFVLLVFTIAFAGCNGKPAPAPRPDSHTDRVVAGVFNACFNRNTEINVTPDSWSPAAQAARWMFCLYGQPQSGTVQDVIAVNKEVSDPLFRVERSQGDQRMELMFRLYKNMAESWGVPIEHTFVRLDGNVNELRLAGSRLRSHYRDLGVQSVVLVKNPLATGLDLQFR